MVTIDGKKIKEEIISEIKKEVELLPFPPVFCDILIGDNSVSALYVRIKEKAAESVGIKFRKAEFSNNSTTEEIIEEIENLNKVPHMCGIIIQLPLPDNIIKEQVLNSISPDLDVDCLGQVTTENFYNNKGDMAYPTALACMKILDSLEVNLTGKNIVVLGQGRLVGQPVTHLLKNRNLKVVTINSQTENIKEILKNADVIISAIGRGKFIKGEMIKDGVIIVDAGTSEENGGIIGDVDFDSVKDKASYLTPSPGGVGPVTVAMLLKNVLQVAKNKK